MSAFLSFLCGALVAGAILSGIGAGFARRDLIHFYNREQRRKGGTEIRDSFFNRGEYPFSKDFDVSSLEPFTQNQVRRYWFWRRMMAAAAVLAWVCWVLKP